MTVLVHSYSTVVLDVLKNASERGVQVKVITTQSHPDATGDIVMAKC